VLVMPRMARGNLLDRRSFLALAGSTLLARGSARSETAVPARVAIAYDDPGRAIAADFIGLSYESALVAAPDYFTLENRSLLGLIRGLGAHGVIRIGGNTSERTVWETGAAKQTPGRYVITPAAVDRLAAFMRKLDWQLIYGLNLADNTPARAADEAAYVARTLGSKLLAFQIGNEPDGFGRWSGVRPARYDVQAFLAEWQIFHAAIHARVPDARFAGPDVAAETDWIPAFAEARPENLVLLTRHYYAAGPATDPGVTLPKLLDSAAQVEPVLRRLEGFGRSYRLPYRIAETNSVYAGGRPGVSDTLGAALWGAELMFQVAAAGGAGVNFHAGPDKVYTPIGGGGAPHHAQPLYYGMLLFAQAARGVLVPARLKSDLNLACFAARADDGSLRVCLINKDARGARLRIDPGRRFATASAMRLAGPSLEATAGTLGGATIDASGRWAPAAPEMLQSESGHVLVDVPGASAALVRMERR
jgi:hypothetical protein